jgi:hypothetical protein
VLSHQKFLVSFSVLLILLLTIILYADFSRPAKAEAETSKSSGRRSTIEECKGRLLRGRRG